MRIAVATIAKNEAKHLARWAASCRDADLRVIGDTGSSDATDTLAPSHGVKVHRLVLRPFRFDDARNALLAQLPADIDVVLTLDMDEVLKPGWRRAIEAAGTADRWTYNYAWGSGIFFQGERCVSRKNWRWRHPVHETLQWVGDGQPHVVDAGFSIQHLPDPGKPRSQYLPMLKQAAEEAPHDDRVAHYYARELFFTNNWVAARKEFVRHLGLPSATWASERANSYRYLAKMDTYPERWLLKAVAEDPGLREAWVDLGEHYATASCAAEAKGAFVRALSITRRSGYISEQAAWDDDAIQGRIAAMDHML